MGTREEEFDAALLKVFEAYDTPTGLRVSDVHGRSDIETGPHGRRYIEASIGRLLESGAIHDVTASMDWHPHYRAVGVLDRLANIHSTKRPRRPR
jgi:hypothetical protein